jgi:hypothetical protein
MIYKINLLTLSIQNEKKVLFVLLQIVVMKEKKGDFSFYVRYSTLIHLPHLRFHCVGRCWDRTQECWCRTQEFFYLHALNIFSNRNKKSVSLAPFLHFCPHQVLVDFKSFPFLPTWYSPSLPPPHTTGMCMQNLQLLPQTFSAEILNGKEENPALCEKAFRAANILRKKLWNFAFGWQHQIALGLF